MSSIGSWNYHQKAPGDSRGTDDLGVFVVHAITLTSGKVLWFSGHAEDGHYKRVAVEWDPLNTDISSFPDRSKPAITQHTMMDKTDYFCCHLTHMPDGRILLIGGSTPFQIWRRKVTYDSVTNTRTEQVIAEGPDTSYGIRDILLFDPNKTVNAEGRGALEKVGELLESRWYPTLVNTADGNILVFSGRGDEPVTGGAGLISETVELIEVNKIDHRKPFYTPEVLTILRPPGTDYVDDAEHNRFLPIYPGMQMSSNGKIYSVGPTWRHEYFQKNGVAPTSTLETDFRARVKPSELEFDTRKKVGKWKVLENVITTNEEGSCILLHPASDGKIMIAGGNTMMSRHTAPYQNLASIPGVDPADSKKVRILDTLAPPTALPSERFEDMEMRKERINLNMVLLPDDTVLIIGGHDNYKWLSDGHLECEIYDPNFTVGDLDHVIDENYMTAPAYTADSAAYLADPANFTPFKVTAPMTSPRTYHSAANLLLDGTVIVAGGVKPSGSEEVFPGAGVFLSAENQKNCEVFHPPYHGVTRSSINSVNGTALNMIDKIDLNYGDQFIVNSNQASTINSIILMRLGAMTHHTDSQQRSVNIVTFSKSGNDITCTIPNDEDLIPPGQYMLWIRVGRVPCQKAAVLNIAQKMDNKGPIGGQGVGLDSEVVLMAVSYNTGTYTETQVDGHTVKLEVNGTQVDLMHFSAAKAWGARGLVFGRFATIKGLAEFIIDNQLI